MAKQLTKQEAQEKLAQYTDKYVLEEYVSGQRTFSTFYDVERDRSVQCNYNSLIQRLKRNPNTTIQTLEEKAEEKLASYTDNYVLLEYNPGAKPLSLFYDKKRDREVWYRFNNFIQKLKKNPDFIPKPSEEDRAQAYKNGYKKREKNFQEKYGVDHPAQLDWVKDKVKKTNLERYGVETNLRLPGVREKAIKGFFENKAWEKAQETIKERHGSLSNPLISEKKRQTNLKRYGVDHPCQSPEILRKLKDSLIASGHCKTLEMRDGSEIVVDEYAKTAGISISYFNYLYRTYGEEFALNYKRSVTAIEALVHEFLEGNSIEFVHDKKLDGVSYQPDFVVQSKKVIIECDGLYWHSDSVKDRNNYHQRKKQAYDELGYKSLFFREDEIREKFPVVCSVITNALGLNKRKIFARKCKIVEIDSDWFSDRHLMGKGAGKCYGLQHNGEIVAGIQIKWVNKKDRIAEISRFCTELETTVVGGFSKLLKHAILEYRPSVLQTFIDRRYGAGDYLSSIGFEYVGTHLSFKWTDYQNTYGRMKFPNGSGYEQGLRKIWDCGQAKWIKRCHFYE